MPEVQCISGRSRPAKSALDKIGRYVAVAVSEHSGTGARSACPRAPPTHRQTPRRAGAPATTRGFQQMTLHLRRTPTVAPSNDGQRTRSASCKQKHMAACEQPFFLFSLLVPCLRTSAVRTAGRTRVGDARCRGFVCATSDRNPVQYYAERAALVVE